MVGADDADLVAVVSLARHLCLHNHVGFCGDTPQDKDPPVAETPAWQVLQRRVFTGFDLARFEERVHAFCRELSDGLAKQNSDTKVTLLA